MRRILTDGIESAAPMRNDFTLRKFYSISRTVIYNVDFSAVRAQVTRLDAQRRNRKIDVFYPAVLKLKRNQTTAATVLACASVLKHGHTVFKFNLTVA